MARVGIDARFYGVNAGIGRYLRNLIYELGKIEEIRKSVTDEFFIFLLKKDIPAFRQTNPPSNFHPVEADFPWYGFLEQTKFPGVLKKYNLDLVHFPNFNVPVFFGGRFIVTIHDLTHLDYKMRRATTRNALYYELKHNVHKRVVTYAVKKSQRIITVSDFVKQEIVKRYKTDPAKIEVTYEGVEKEFVEKAQTIGSGEINKTLEKFNIREPFIYYIGAAHPHKNIEGLIRAFLKLRKRYQYLTLALAGEDNYFWKRIKEENPHIDIKFLGLVKDEESIALFKSAAFFILPSFSEGFGIPMLEAMCCGTPVVSSNAGSLKEVGGDAALYFDPRNLEEMEEKMVKVLDDKLLREKLKKKGLERYKKFSFSKMAQETLNIYNSCLAKQETNKQRMSVYEDG